jgi:mannose-6-phosphate isomerase-like protein (cupin superfamily)
MAEVELFKKDQAKKRGISASYSVANFLTKKDCEEVSLAVSEARGHSETTKNTKSNRVYYLLEGELIVKKGEEEFRARPGDVIFVPRDTEYHFEGTFKAVLINSPAFDPKNEEIIEE